MSLFGDEDVIVEDELSEFAEEQYDPEKLDAPESMPFCLGHAEQEKQFLDLFKQNAMPHAMIFSGPKGVGKSVMAFRLARFLFKYGKQDDNQDGLFGGDEELGRNYEALDIPENDPVFARVTSGGYADFLYLKRHFDTTKGKMDAALKVEAIRTIEPFLRKTSSDGGWRVVIVDDADTMNRNAQNAILKILEEPPQKTLIILITHRPGMLIPTIRSRSRVIDFKPLSQDIISELLNRQGYALSIDERETLYALSDGSFGQVQHIAEQGGLEILPTILNTLDQYPNWNWEAIHKQAASLAPAAQDQDYRMFAELLQWIFRQILFVKARGQGELPACLQREGIQRISESLTLEQLINVTDNLKAHFERVDFSNLNRHDAVRGSFLVISE